MTALKKLSSDALALLDSAAVATVVTLNRDGSPHLSAAWIGRDGDELVMGTLNDQRKLRNLRRDARIAVLVYGERINEWGLREYLVLEGLARVVPGGAPQLLQELARTYIGPEAVFPAMPNPPPGYVTRIAVEHISGIGSWTRDGETDTE
jgi:PPOX class probable F420-dependent enzyme